MTENVQLEASAPGVAVATTPRPDFHLFASTLSVKYNVTSAKQRIYRTELEKNLLFSAFLDSFSDPVTRQYYNCECCRHFLNKFGGLVTIDPNTGISKSAIWNLTENESFALTASDAALFLPAMDTMRRLVEKAKVQTVFLSKYELLGIPDKGGWKHMFLKQGTLYDKLIPSAGEAMLTSRENRRILTEFMGPIDVDLLKNIVTYFKNDADLKNVTDKIAVFEWAFEFKKTWSGIKNRTLADNYLWNAVATKSMSYLRVGGGVTGEFIDTIKSGGTYDTAKANFLSQTNMKNYMKPTAPAAIGNIKLAERVFEQAGLASALRRRHAHLGDIRTTLWVPPTPPVVEKPTNTPVFGHLKPKDAPVKLVVELPVINGGTITLERFMAEVIPSAEKLFMDIQAHRLYDFMGIITACDPEAKPLLLWDSVEHRNPVSGYSYHGGSQPRMFGLSLGMTEVTHILPCTSKWATPKEQLVGVKTNLTWILKGARDGHMSMIPLSGALVRRDLHEIRATLQSFFDAGKLEELEEGAEAIAGLSMPFEAAGASINVHVQVIKTDACVNYFIDRTS